MLDFVISLVLLFVLMFFYGIPLRVSLLWLPTFVMLMLTATLGVG
jgi:hypothetical protein